MGPAPILPTAGTLSGPGAELIGSTGTNANPKINCPIAGSQLPALPLPLRCLVRRATLTLSTLGRLVSFLVVSLAALGGDATSLHLVWWTGKVHRTYPRYLPLVKQDSSVIALHPTQRRIAVLGEVLGDVVNYSNFFHTACHREMTAWPQPAEA